MTSVPVLIVGGSVVGLSAALLLAQHDVDCLVVERRHNTSSHPRSRGINVRSMEIMRQLGLQAEIIEAGKALAGGKGFLFGPTLIAAVKPRSYYVTIISAAIMIAAALTERVYILWYCFLVLLFILIVIAIVLVYRFRDLIGENSPTQFTWCTQDVFEPVLLKSARARGVDVRFLCEVTDIIYDADGVTTSVLDRNVGTISLIRSKYVIGCDGGNSFVRQKLSIDFIGPGVLSQQIGIYFRAELANIVRGHEFSQCVIENNAVRGHLVSINNNDLWVFHAAMEIGATKKDYPDDRCIHLIRSAVGVADLAVEVRSRMLWNSVVRIAAEYAKGGRIFLAGDSAHVMPPWGGYNGNTGIQDAHNLVWKLAAVINGSAGAKLLSTYEVERRPVALAVSSIAGNMNDEHGLMKRTPLVPALGIAWRMRDGFSFIFSVGYAYASSAIELEKNLPPNSATRLDGRPGTRIPHVWIERNGSRVASIDLCQSLTLLVGVRGQQWMAAVAAATITLNLKINILQAGSAFTLVNAKAWSSSFGVDDDGAILVRPDHFVAWRAKNSTNADKHNLMDVLKRIYHRTE